MGEDDETDASARFARLVERMEQAGKVLDRHSAIPEELGRALEEMGALARSVEELRLKIDRTATELEDLQLKGTRPRLHTIPEIAMQSMPPDSYMPASIPPHVTASINAIEREVAKQPLLNDRNRAENRWLSFAIAFLVAVTAAFNALYHH